MGNGPFFNNEVIKNKYVWYSIGGGFFILLGIIQITFVRQALNIIPMTMREWLIILTASFGSLLIIQVFKSFQLFIKK